MVELFTLTIKEEDQQLQDTNMSQDYCFFFLFFLCFFYKNDFLRNRIKVNKLIVTKHNNYDFVVIVYPKTHGFKILAIKYRSRKYKFIQKVKVRSGQNRTRSINHNEKKTWHLY